MTIRDLGVRVVVQAVEDRDQQSLAHFREGLGGEEFGLVPGVLGVPVLSDFKVGVGGRCRVLDIGEVVPQFQGERVNDPRLFVSEHSPTVILGQLLILILMSHMLL